MAFRRSMVSQFRRPSGRSSRGLAERADQLVGMPTGHDRNDGRDPGDCQAVVILPGGRSLQSLPQSRHQRPIATMAGLAQLCDRSAR